MCFIKESNADEVLTSIRAFYENIKLFGQLFMLSMILLEFSSHACHEVGRHSRDSYEFKDIAQQGDELCFNYFADDIIDEIFQSNL